MRRCIVVGIAGGSASGKSTVVEEVIRLLGPGRTAWLPHDAYYRDLSHLSMAERIRVNVDHPDSLETELLVTHVRELLAGRPVEVPRYDYISQTRSARGIHVQPAPAIVVEGLLALHDERLRTLMDLTAFVDAPEEDRLARRIARDTEERGRSLEEVVRQHHERVQPMHDRFVAPAREVADVVVEGGGHNVPAIQALVAGVEALLKADSKTP